MTTIAYRDGLMAADSGAWTTSGTLLGHTDKIDRLEDGTLIGSAGDYTATVRALEWLAAGKSEESKPEFGEEEAVLLLIVHSDGAVGIAMSDLVECPLLGDYFAIGSGCELALGAMAAGARAEEAVLIACRFDSATIGPVMTERLHP